MFSGYSFNIGFTGYKRKKVCMFFTLAMEDPKQHSHVLGSTKLGSCQTRVTAHILTPTNKFKALYPFKGSYFCFANKSRLSADFLQTTIDK